MALVHCDPFAHYTSAHYTDIYTVGGFGATLAMGPYGRSGRPGLRFSGDHAFSIDRLSLSTSGAICIFQADLRISAAPSSTNVLFAPLLGGSIQCSVDLNTDRTLAVYRGFAGTKTQLGSNSTYIVPLDTTIHLAVTFTIGDGTSGSIVVHVWEDGDAAARVVLNVTGVDTKAGATATWDGFNLSAATAGTTDWSNLVVMDGSGTAANAVLGPADVWALWASARTTPALTDWSLSTGADAAALTDDATPDDDTTYLEETTQHQQMTVAVDPVPYPDRAIVGAQLYASVKLTTGAPSLTAIGYESATAHLGVAQAPTAAYTYLMGPYSAMPGGAAFSTAAAFDALQWGLKLTTSATGARVTQIVVALIQHRDPSTRNLLVGFGHTVGGDDNVAAGRANAVTGSTSEAHGSGATVMGDRSILINLDGVPRTLTGSGKFEVYGDVGGDVAAAIHHTRHEAGGADAIKLDDLAAPDDTTDLDATTSEHGLLPKLSGLDVEVLRGDGTWGNSPLTSGVFAYIFSTTITAPPGSQRIRFDAGHPYTAVTKLWADFDSSNSEDLYWGWMRIRVGSLIIVQDKDDHLQFAEFTTTGDPIDQGTYVELPVAWASNGTALAVQAVLTRVTAPAPGGSGANAFGTIQVSGQSDVVADAAPDTLTLVAGSNITLTTNAGADSITIAASGGGSGGGGLIGVQTITATGAGTYTPTSGTASVVLELQGAGGGGGGVAGTGGSSNGAFGRGGGGGGYVRVHLTAAFSGASYSVGAKGTGGAAGNNAGTAGGNTVFTATGGGTVYTAGGGGSGSGGGPVVPPMISGVAAGGTATNGTVNRPGDTSVSAICLSASKLVGARGASSLYGAGAEAVVINASNTSTAGVAATGTGAGGGGAAVTGTGAAAAGGNGSDGLILIWEYS